MSDERHDHILTALAAFEQTIPRAAAAESADAVARVQYQSGRLAQAVRHSHAEGIRFAAYTIGHVMAASPHAFDEAARRQFAAVKQALAAAGHHV